VTQRPEIEPLLDVEAEYRAIEAALLETARGRWFLAEHSRRSRRMETIELENALSSLKSSLRDPPALLGRLQSELQTIAELLEKARKDALARDPRDAIDAPAAPTMLLQAAEKLHEHAWDLQAREVDADLCEQIGRQTAVIFALSVRQAQEAQRSKRHVEMIDAVADRVAGIIRTVMFESAMDNTIDAPALTAAG
jgi:hypothetical protein